MLTRLAGWYAGLESRTLTRLSLAVWQRFGGPLHLEEASTSDFTSVRACFTRSLKPEARPIDPRPSSVISPCDGIVMAAGRVERGMLIQAKGLTYSLEDLLGDTDRATRHDGDWYVTLRLRSTMYHRFHAPCDGTVDGVRYIAGDTFNVNPVTVRRLERLYCRNARVVLALRPEAPVAGPMTLVAVAAILVASVRLYGLPHPLDARTRVKGALPFDRDTRKGDELGHFENGSTIIVLAPAALSLEQAIVEGHTIRMGEPLFHLNLHPPVTNA